MLNRKMQWIGVALLPCVILACATGASGQTSLSSSSPVLLLDAPMLRNAEHLRDLATSGQNVAYDVVEGLTTEIGARPTGSATERLAADWAMERLKTLGFQNVHAEAFPVAGWTRGQETAEVIAPFPQRLVITALGGSVATPPQGVVADAVIFSSYEALIAAPPGSLTGKIAVVTEPMPVGGYEDDNRIRSQGPAEAAKRGAVAYLHRSLATDVRRLPHTGTTTYYEVAGQARSSLPSIPAAALSAPDAEQLQRIAARGRPVRLHLTLTPTSSEGQIAKTVVGEIPGRSHPNEIVLLGAHLDSWDLGTGAIDDGAGVAIAIAAAKLVAGLAQPPERTIRVVLFGAEEIGQASAPYAAAHPPEEHAIAAESDEGSDRILSIALPKGVAEGRLGRSLGYVLGPTGISIDPTPAERGGADLARLTGVPRAKLKQDDYRYFEIHHSADDTLDKIDRRALDQNVAAWAVFTYLAANSEIDFRHAGSNP